MKSKVRCYGAWIASLIGVGSLWIGFGSLPAVSDDPVAPPASGAPPTPPAQTPKLALIKPAPTGASTYPWLPDYLRVLERFPAYHARAWRELDVSGAKVGYFGSGDRAGAVSQARAMLALAYLGTEPAYDPRPSGIAAATLRSQAVQSLRYLIRTHARGDLGRVGGGRWGGDAAATRAVPPLAAASQLLAAQLTPEELKGVEQVVEREADRLLEQEPVAGKPRESGAPENAAAAECLAWAAALLPERPNAPRWEYQVRLFATNTLSAPQDRGGETPVDSRPIRDWVVTENLLPEYLVESGGAVNPDAALEALGSLCGGYYAYTSRGRPVPEALTHHFEDTWGAVRGLWLGDHRIAQPAGWDMARGAGAGLSVLPVTALLEWVGTEPSAARLIERNRFLALDAVQAAHGDGSFFGGRAGPEAEAAAAGSVALAGLIHRRQGTMVAPAEAEPLRRQLAGAWTSPSAALAVARSRGCFASWSWRSVGRPAGPAGLFVPLDAEALTPWAPDQLIGSFALEGFEPARTVHHRARTIEGGFAVAGQIEEGRKEGRSGLHHFVAFAALPGERVAVAFDLAVAAQGVTVTRNEGFRLHVANDAENGNRRTVRSEEGELTITGLEPGQPDVDRPIASPWLNVDDRLGVVSLYSQEPFTLRDLSGVDPVPPLLVGEGARRRGAAEVIANPYSTQPTAYQAGQIVRDTVMLLVAGDTATTTRLARLGTVLPTGGELVRAAVVPGAEGGRYLVAANFGLKETKVTLRPPDSPPLTDLRLPPLETTVRKLER